MDTTELQHFWADVRRDLDAVRLDAETQRVEPEPDRLVQTWRVTLTGLENVRFRAILTVPDLGVEARPLPAVVYTPGYGGDTPHTAMAGLAYDKGIAVLTVYPRGQGESTQYWQVPEGRTKLTMGLGGPREQYYRAGYADCLRGIDFLCSRDDIDSERIGAVGLSQGGGLTLATAALDPRVKCAVAHEPFLCNYPVAVETATTGPYLELVNLFAEQPGMREPALETLAWFDPINLAQLITCPTFITIGLADTTCPPETIRPVYERVGGLRGLVEIPDAGHGWYYIYRDLDDLWLRRHL
jgi:cephalosporin-C deacetylase